MLKTGIESTAYFGVDNYEQVCRNGNFQRRRLLLCKFICLAFCALIRVVLRVELCEKKS